MLLVSTVLLKARSNAGWICSSRDLSRLIALVMSCARPSSVPANTLRLARTSDSNYRLTAACAASYAQCRR